MLCGAADVKEYSKDFIRVVKGFGGDSLWYQDGSISYQNSKSTSWEKNSAQTVNDADICVFAIRETIGDITWNTEFQVAYENGKPFIILCYEGTFDRYRHDKEHIKDITDPYSKELVRLLDFLNDRALTIVPFEGGSGFKDTLAEQLAGTIREGLRALSKEYREKPSTNEVKKLIRSSKEADAPHVINLSSATNFWYPLDILGSTTLKAEEARKNSVKLLVDFSKHKPNYAGYAVRLGNMDWSDHYDNGRAISFTVSGSPEVKNIVIEVKGADKSIIAKREVKVPLKVKRFFYKLNDLSDFRNEFSAMTELDFLFTPENVSGSGFVRISNLKIV